MKIPALLLTAALAVSVSVQAEPAHVSLKLVADGVVEPVSFVPLADGRALVADQVGYIRLLKAGGGLTETPVADLRGALSAINQNSFDERGLLCLALHPDFAKNRRLFACYTAPRRASAPAEYDCTLRVSEFTLPAAEPLKVDPASEKIVLEVDKPYFNHNGGRIAFGPDGLLYISVGDGGGPKGCDIGLGHVPEGNGQNLHTLLAKILRVDVSGADAATGKAYRIPSDNPFADGKEGLPEIYAYGVRNPWAISFDRGGQHELFEGDVGQMRWEEVNIIAKGGNYGWPLREGFDGMNREHPELAPTEPKAEKGLRGEPLIDPIAVYKNISGWRQDTNALGCSVTGGYVYRGKALPEFTGHYVYGDWSGTQGQPQGRLFVARRPAGGKGQWAVEPLRVSGAGKFFGCVTAFGQDNDGEVYVLTNGSTTLTPGRGKIWKIVPEEKVATN
jgi:glucose/arabinose dehydrogenase